MNCQVSRNYIMKYFDGNLGEAEKSGLKKHLEDCGSCFADFNQMKEVLGELDIQPDIEIPLRFEAMVMEKVSTAERVRREKSSRRLVFVYNTAIFMSIVLLIVFTADLKQSGILNAFNSIGEYTASFSTALTAVFDVVNDIFAFLGGVFRIVIGAAFSVVKAYYYVFLIMMLLLFASNRLLNYVGIRSTGKNGGKTL